MRAVRDACRAAKTMQLLQTIQHKSQGIVMEHWLVEIKTCEYHEDERTPCAICLALVLDYQIEQAYENLREQKWEARNGKD